MNVRQWVAVIDDDASIRAALCRLLRISGIHVEAFGSAEEYLAKTAPGEPQCILLDVHLGPGLSGFELEERLAAGGGGPGPGVIFMTGRSEVRFPHLGRNGEPLHFLRKPLDIEKLLELVERHLERKVSTLAT
jgi:FixJ family two-component response regulator